MTGTDVGATYFDLGWIDIGEDLVAMSGFIFVDFYGEVSVPIILNLADLVVGPP